MPEHQLREVDAWFRRIAVWGPVVSFVLGWGSGVLTAAILYKDHEVRISKLETWRDAHTVYHIDSLAQFQALKTQVEERTGKK